jgi:stage III sporulation protein AG
VRILTNDKDEKGEQQKSKKLDAIGTKKKTQMLMIVIVVVIILVIYFSSSFDTGFLRTDKKQPEATDLIVKDDIETEIEEKLSLIEGAGIVKVIISYEYSKELVPVYLEDIQTSVMEDNSDNATSTSKTENHQSEVVTINKNSQDSALIIKEKSAVVKGVIVIAQGAGDINVKYNLLGAIQTLLDISPEQVEVYEMKK